MNRAGGYFAPTAARALAGVVWAGSLCAACANFPEPTPLPAWTEIRQTAPAIPDDERALWEEAVSARAEQETEGVLYDDEVLNRYLSGVLASIHPATRLPDELPEPSVAVVRSAVRAASTDAAGRIYVSVGLLGCLHSEDELAALLGHELAHFLNRDALREKRYQARTTSTVARMRLSRSRELEADRLGLELASAAGYDPHAMRDFLRRLAHQRSIPPGTVLEWQTHPDIPARIDAIRRILDANAQPRKARREAPYEQAILDLLLVDAELALDSNELEHAKRSIDRHLRGRPESARGIYLQAEYLRLTRDSGREDPEVREGYERALALAPDDPDVLRALGLLLRDQGENDRSHELIARYLEVAGDVPDRKILERYLEEE